MTHFKIPTLLIKSFIFVPLFLISNLVNATLILNGDFNTDLSHWNDASDNGSVAYDNGNAVLQGGDGTSPYSAVFVQGDDGFFNFSSPLTVESGFNWLSFDLWQISNEIDNTEIAVLPFYDHLNVMIYDSIDFSYDLEFLNLSVTNIQQSFTFDISSLIGRSVAFSFELVDEQDGFNIAYGLDNIELISKPNVQVAEPSTIALFVLMLMLILINKKQKTKLFFPRK
jgi:hypothetical protein